MKRDDVRKKMETFLGYMRQEQEIKQQLMQLKFVADSEDEVRDAIDRQSKLLKELRDLREEKALPLLDQVAAYVGAQRAKYEAKGAAKGAAKGPAVAAKPAAKPAPKAAAPAKPVAKRK